MEVFEAAEPGSEYVITRYRRANCNLRTQLERILGRAGLKPWPKLFQNLRSTRETELCESFPEHVVTAWIGNTRKVARDHYLQIRDEDFERAASGPEGAQNPAQSGTVGSGKEGKTTLDRNHANGVLPVETAACKSLQDKEMEPMRVELTTSCMPCKRSPN